MGRFFGAVDDGLDRVLAAERAPLILAAVAYEQDLYRLTSKYPHVAPEGIECNSDRTTAKVLHANAWPIAWRALEAPVEDAKVAYLEASSAGDASDVLGEILRAAHEGRVSTLLLRAGAETWGSYDFETGQTEAHTEAQPFDADLIDLAVRQALLHRGEAYVIGPEEMPCRGAIAAVYGF